jgi:hypothetical protein
MMASRACSAVSGEFRFGVWVIYIPHKVYYGK